MLGLGSSLEAHSMGKRALQRVLGNNELCSLRDPRRCSVFKGVFNEIRLGQLFLPTFIWSLVGFVFRQLSFPPGV